MRPAAEDEEVSLPSTETDEEGAPPVAEESVSCHSCPTRLLYPFSFGCLFVRSLMYAVVLFIEPGACRAGAMWLLSRAARRSTHVRGRVFVFPALSLSVLKLLGKAVLLACFSFLEWKGGRESLSGL
jgi:hypothetical protein